MRRFVSAMLIIVMILCSGFYIIYKITGKKSTAANTSNTVKAANPTVTNKMNSRESDVNFSQPETDIYKADGHKTAYLTFDDGPSPKTTPLILKTLDKYNIKATFFIIGSMAVHYPDLVKAEAKDGQSIGNHTYSHNYKYLYSDTKNFINDVKKCETVLKSILGSTYTGKLVRFPGGSFGARLAPFREALKNSGYNYIDWNDVTGDADGQNIPVNKLLSNLKKYTKGKQHVVILMHDAPAKKTTVQALPQVIEYLKSQGYAFSKLTE